MTDQTPECENRPRLQGLQSHFASCIRGQQHVIERVARALIRSELCLHRHARFLFLGPTGVGKTELANVFTAYLRGGESGHAHRIDCSEFPTEEAVSGFLKDERNSKGRLASLKMSRGDTLIFDEIEKAEGAFRDLLLQLLEPGRITLSSGRVVDVSQLYIVCTGNIASKDILALRRAPFSSIERHILRSAEKVLRPEVLNRFDETLVFRPLEYDMQVEILEQHLAAYVAQMRELQWRIQVHQGVIPFLVRHGFDRRMGARPLLRAIRRYVGDALAARALAGAEQEGVLQVAENGQELVLGSLKEEREQAAQRIETT